MKPLLEVVGLQKIFSAVKQGAAGWSASPAARAVDDVSFSIGEAEVFGLVGESGCGKTTLARCILRLVEPTAGQIRFRGEDWLSPYGSELRQARKQVQAVFQNPYASLNARTRVADIVEEPLIVHGLGERQERRERVAELLDMVGLGEDQAHRRPPELSGGQRQRVALARALATRPLLLVADEPVSSLDISIQAQIINLLVRLQEESRLALLFISHSLPLVRHLCDRVAVMQEGRVVEVGKTSELFEHPRHPYTRELLEAAARLGRA